MIDPDFVYSNYPWLVPSDHQETIIIGDDLDSALATVLFLHTHPNSKVVGIYRGYTNIIYNEALDWNTILNSLWLDLDIYDSSCRSLGHHIIRLTSQDRLLGFSNSCNLNELTGTSHKNFRHKYPLGTIHFLMYLYGVEIPDKKMPIY